MGNSLVTAGMGGLAPRTVGDFTDDLGWLGRRAPAGHSRAEAETGVRGMVGGRIAWNVGVKDRNL